MGAVVQVLGKGSAEDGVSEWEYERGVCSEGWTREGEVGEEGEEEYVDDGDGSFCAVGVVDVEVIGVEFACVVDAREDDGIAMTAICFSSYGTVDGRSRRQISRHKFQVSGLPSWAR